MSRVITADLLDQFLRAISMVRFTVEEFDDEQWLAGYRMHLCPYK